MHGQSLRQMEEVTDNDQWFWLIEGGLKRETETLIMAAQEQGLIANLVKAKTDKTQDDSKCRICGKTDESISQIFSECSKLTQKNINAGIIGREERYIGRYVETFLEMTIEIQCAVNFNTQILILTCKCWSVPKLKETFLRGRNRVYE